MLLQELLDRLNELPQYARTAILVVENTMDEGDVVAVRYEQGKVILDCTLASDEKKVPVFPLG